MHTGSLDALPFVSTLGTKKVHATNKHGANAAMATAGQSQGGVLCSIAVPAITRSTVGSLVRLPRGPASNDDSSIGALALSADETGERVRGDWGRSVEISALIMGDVSSGAGP